MNTIIFLLFAVFTQYSNPNEDVNSMELEQIETGISNWADSLFISHEGDKFESHRAFYSDEYFIHTTKSELYTERIKEIQNQKEDESYPGSEEDYIAALKKLEDALL